MTKQQILVLSPLDQATFKVLLARLEGLRGFWKDSRCSGGSPTWKSAERDIFTCFRHPSKPKRTDTQPGASAREHTLSRTCIHPGLSVLPLSPTRISIRNRQEQNEPVRLFRLGSVKPPSCPFQALCLIFSSSSFQTHYVDKRDRFGSSANLFKHFSFTATLNHRKSQWPDHDSRTTPSRPNTVADGDYSTSASASANSRLNAGFCRSHFQLFPNKQKNWSHKSKSDQRFSQRWNNGSYLHACHPEVTFG